MGFLNDLGLENVEADPNHIADGKYRAFVFNSEVRLKKDQSRSWVITYKIAPNQKHAGQQQQEWFDLEPKGDNAEIKKSFLKSRVLSLGVPESKIADLSPADLIGTEVDITIVHRNGYQNVGVLTLPTGDAPAATEAASASTSSLL
jgi:hypothetical protein